MSNESDFFIVSPEDRQWSKAKPRGGEPYRSEEREQRKKEVDGRKLEKRIQAVRSSIGGKDLRDPRNIYLVVEADEQSTVRQLHEALERLSATVRGYLNKEHNLLLVSLPERTLYEWRLRDLPLSVKEPLKDLRELTENERLGRSLIEDHSWLRGAKPTIVQVIPNVAPPLLENYLSHLLAYFKGKDVPILWSSPSELGMISVEIDRATADDLLRRSNYVFNINPVPKAIATKQLESRTPKRRSVKAKPSSLGRNPVPSVNDLPIVCVADSGVTEIPILNGLIVERGKYPTFSSPDDEESAEGHGTPIACLVARGEGSGSPRAKIISYKIYSSNSPLDAYQGMTDAIRIYSSRARIFVTSINFEIDANPLFARLDTLIRLSNVCFVSSAGNIAMHDIVPNVNDYPQYISRFPVSHPAQNVHVIGVGAISRKTKEGSIAPREGLSPFTRCGKTLSRLYDAEKPDTVEHGGNMCYRSYDSSEIGVSTFGKDGEFHDDLLGTSYAAPLVAGRLAELVAKYGGRVRNAETFKALLFASWSRRNTTCVGYGIPDRFLSSGPNNAVFVAEGTIPLSDLTPRGSSIIYADTVSIPVPSNVGRIDMCLVHSDSIDGLLGPGLETHLQVKARKGGRERSPVPSLDESVQNLRSNTKFFSWRFERRSMQAMWNFDIIPQTMVDIDPVYRRQIEVRYGCVIMLTCRDSGLYPLSRIVRQEMRRWERAIS